MSRSQLARWGGSLGQSIAKAKRFLPLVALVPGVAFAHSDASGLLHGHLSGMQSGWLHPFTGVDHLLAMIALGLWAGQRGGRAQWTLPGAFLACLLIGGVIGLQGAAVPAMEPLLLVSVLLLGGAIASAARMAGWSAMALAGVVAFYHGVAHGVEVPKASAPVAYVVGFLLASAALHLCGVVLAVVLRRAGIANATRVAGAGIAATGILLLLNTAA